MNKKIIVANWKMNHDFYETTYFIRNLIKNISDKKNFYEKEIIIAPSFPFLHISNQISQGTALKIAAQNIHYSNNGSYTGEVSTLMLKSIGVNQVIIGHSERRNLFFEEENILLKKIKTSINNKIKIIFCIGESKNERKNNKHFFIIKKQLEKTIFQCSEEHLQYIYIAYEPVWAIGKGITPTIKQIQEMHKFIKSLFYKKFSKTIPIIYGGSVNDKNAKNILSIEGVNGVLVGNSSLNLNEFIKIIKS